MTPTKVLDPPGRALAHPDGMPKTRVLLVDDDEDYTLVVRRIVARLGNDVPIDVVHDEASALDILRRHRYDLIVTDYDLNPGCGVRVLRHARDIWPGAHRILLTSAPDKAQKELQAQPVAHGVWDKRWDLAAIRSLLTTLLKADV